MSLEMMKGQVDDHECRIRTLEKNQTEMKYNLLNIEKSQSDLKLLVTESNMGVNKILEKFVDCNIGIAKNNNQNIWNFLFKVWAVVAPIAAGIFGYKINS
jgi:hypothetical protein